MSAGVFKKLHTVKTESDSKISISTMENALDIIKKLLPLVTSRPDVIPHPETGALSFMWEFTEGYCDLEIENENYIFVLSNFEEQKGCNEEDYAYQIFDYVSNIKIEDIAQRINLLSLY